MFPLPITSCIQRLDKAATMGKGLTDQQIKFYKDNGYIHIKNLLTPREVEELSTEYDNLFKRKNQGIMENSWVGGVADDLRITDSPYSVKGVHNLQNHHACFSMFLSNEKLLDCLEDVMGTPNIMLHHTKAHLKPPEKGAMYPMHQDYHYFPYELDSPVAVFLHLDRCDPENGGLHVYPGSHKLGPLEDFGAKEGDYHWVNKEKFPIEKATPVIAEKGDIVIFSYLLVHGSTLNTSKNRYRRMFLAQYLNADDKQLPAVDLRVQPGFGWLFRGVNKNKDESVAKRFSHT